MQLSAGLHGDTVLLKVQLSMFSCYVTGQYLLSRRHKLASYKQVGRDRVTPATASKVPLQCDSFNAPGLLQSICGTLAVTDCCCCQALVVFQAQLALQLNSVATCMNCTCFDTSGHAKQEQQHMQMLHTKTAQLMNCLQHATSSSNANYNQDIPLQG